MTREDPDSAERWGEVENSPLLWDLASSGHALYKRIFPDHSEVRRSMDRLAPGGLLDVTWIENLRDRPENIPWGLLYRDDPGIKGQRPVKPSSFVGLRHRISYQVSKAPTGPALGLPPSARRGHLYYYWGREGEKSDKTLEVALDQHERWKAQAGYDSFPAVLPNTNPATRDDLIAFLARPGANMTQLYVFCECDTRDDEVELSFGPNAAVLVSDLPQEAFADEPFVFFNACKSSGARGPIFANPLEAHFLERRCRGYLGTVNRVPTVMANQFAEVFFHFFYRKVQGSPEPIAVGEAVAQARRFLWTEYRHIGGLFYNYVNQYKLYAATEAEVAELKTA